MRIRVRGTRTVAALALLVIAAGACGSGSKDSGGGSGGSGTVEAIRVPQDYKTIQAAADAAKPGDLVLVDPGVYREAVDVTTPNITIRGTDRNTVILDGGFELENGIRVLDTNGVVVENMTARNYVTNGFFWTGSDYYRGSYLTAYRNGDYGVYAFDAYHGQFDNSYGGGSPDAGFYIGECFKCDAVIDNVVSENNGLGYSGTNAGGDLFIVNSTFRNNRAGIVPNTGAYELCYPERESTIVGNLVYNNNNSDAPGIDAALVANGNGILVPGGVGNTIERNRVWDHERTGIGLVPFPEEDANDLPPAQTEWKTPCSETHDKKVPKIPADQCDAIDGLLAGCAVLWNPFDNSVVGNVVEGSGIADLVVATVDLFATGETVETLRNCFSDNTFATTAPLDLETLAPCEGTGSGGDWAAGALDLLGLFTNPAPAPPEDTFKKTPVPGDQENMPGGETAPAPRFRGPDAPGHRGDQGSGPACGELSIDRDRSRRPIALALGAAVLAAGIGAIAVARGGASHVQAMGPAAARRAGAVGPERHTGPQGRVGQFVVTCRYSHSGPNDPIVHFGHAGRSHRHDFYGAVGTDARSTPDDLVRQRTTCDKLPDTAAYWHPTLYDGAADVVPRSIAAYYRAAPGVAPTEVQPYPFGIAIIAGDATATTPRPGEAAGWVCGSSTDLKAAPPSCPVSAPLHMVLTFQDCWDGRHLDSVDHQSHVAYSARGKCPASHPVHVPQLSVTVNFGLSGVGHDLRLASGNVYSAHGDFLNAWDPAGLEREVNGCIHRDVVCELASNREEEPLFQHT